MRNTGHKAYIRMDLSLDTPPYLAKVSRERQDEGVRGTRGVWGLGVRG